MNCRRKTSSSQSLSLEHLHLWSISGKQRSSGTSAQHFRRCTDSSKSRSNHHHIFRPYVFLYKPSRSLLTVQCWIYQRISKHTLHPLVKLELLPVKTTSGRVLVQLLLLCEDEPLRYSYLCVLWESFRVEKCINLLALHLTLKGIMLNSMLVVKWINT